MEFRYKKKFIANNGKNGEGSNKYGKSADNLYIKVPIGTVVKDEKTGRIVCDLSKKGQCELVLKGGKGGRRK